jgi:hypothetical protein
MMKLRTKTVRTAANKKIPLLMKNSREASPSKPCVKADKNTSRTSIDKTRKFIGLV